MKGDKTTDEIIKESMQNCVNDGIVLGMKQMTTALNDFLDEKVKRGHSEYISRSELKTFTEEYIKLTKEHLDADED